MADAAWRAMLDRMNENAGEPAFVVVPTTLNIFRFYSAGETAEIFAATVEDLDEWAQGGFIEPVCLAGEPQYSGFAIARLLGWPLSDDPRGYLPEQDLE